MRRAPLLIQLAGSMGFSVLLLSGCQGKRTAPSKPVPSLAPARPAAPAPAPSVVLAPPSAEQRATSVLLAWNSALDQHDMSSLAALYSSQVLFYGSYWTAQKVIAAKRSALDKTPDYRQRIDDVRVSRDALRTTLEFQKHSGPDAKSVVSARLTLQEEASRLVIVEETDALTDKRLQTRLPSSCYEAALQVFDQLPEIRSDVVRVARENPDCNLGGILNSEDAQNVDSAQGYFHPDRFEPRWQLVVVHGELKIADLFGADPLPISAAQRARVRLACRAASDSGSP